MDGLYEWMAELSWPPAMVPPTMYTTPSIAAARWENTSLQVWHWEEQHARVLTKQAADPYACNPGQAKIHSPAAQASANTSPLQSWVQELPLTE